MGQHEHWTTGHRYLDMATYWQWQFGQQITDNEAPHQEQRATLANAMDG